jgi:glycine/D-amino acid oxidase-like deaminating enzyme
VARGAHQLPAIQSALRAYERLGLDSHYRLLAPEEVTERVRATDVHGGLYTTDGASLHPGRLVRGLARAVEARGAVIFEQTAVTGFHSGERCGLETDAGELCARIGVVIAGEAYITTLKNFHRSLLPVYSLISLTEPLSAHQWAKIGWEQGENLSSARQTVVYLTKTADGRILFGSRGAPYAYGSEISEEQEQHPATHELIQRSLIEWFPSLEGVRFTHHWGGAVGMPRDWMPGVSWDSRERIGFLGGYTGQGVSTSNLAGRILAGMISETNSGFESLPFVQHRSPKWFIEPLRWLVVRYMQDAFLRIDRNTEAGKRRPWDAPIAEFLGRH